jgi:hypothetical protein
LKFFYIALSLEKARKSEKTLYLEYHPMQMMMEHVPLPSDLPLGNFPEK